MGCVSSKNAISDLSPALDVAITRRRRHGPFSSSAPLQAQAAAFGPLERIKEEPDDPDDQISLKRKHVFIDYSGNLRPLRRNDSQKSVPYLIGLGRLAEEEQAPGWPAWLSAVAAEAVEGWLPLRSDTFQKFEKIGQGTYSHVYRARNMETGKMVALKKVRFDNFQPESVRFMAREILILRKLDHPNVMKLEGIITSRLSCNLYLVFEYMEHDLSGLLSSPDIKFTDSQIKCYMQQLLNGVEHCHSQGVMHRDIKSSNILVNNEGILKIADFGLANFMNPGNKQPPLTSRVVTLWYRPPELLLGSTNYGAAVDLWSVGCVFAEFFSGRPILKGRTEVEQLHKIFKLCGSPNDEYWKCSKLPLAAMFKPQHPYARTLLERCKEFPKTAVSLIETFLSIEPHKRGTAASALNHEYFTTRPHACDPSSMPRCTPNKEIDSKHREEARRRRTGSTSQTQSGSRDPQFHSTLQEPSNIESEANLQVARGKRRGNKSRMSSNQSYDTKSESSKKTELSRVSSTRSVPVLATSSSSFSGAKPKEDELSTRLRPHPTSRSHVSNAVDSHGLNSYDSSDVYEQQELSLNYGNKRKKGSMSGPLLYQSQEMATRQHNKAGQVLHRSRFYEDS